MKLSLENRLILTDVLPKEGNYATMLLREDVLSKVKLTQDEMTRWDVSLEGNNFTWDEKKVEEIEVVFTEAEIGMIKKRLSELDSTSMLNPNTTKLYKLFN